MKQVTNVPGFGFYVGATALLLAGAALFSVTATTKQPTSENVLVADEWPIRPKVVAGYVDQSGSCLGGLQADGNPVGCGDIPASVWEGLPKKPYPFRGTSLD